MNKIKLFTGALILNFIFVVQAFSQCSICTKTTQQMGDGPAKGFNTGIIYLALLPLALIAVLGLRWWFSEKKNSR